MKHLFYLFIIFFLSGCSGTDGVAIKSLSLQGIEATIREDVPVGSSLSGELYLQNAPANLADVQISLAGSGNSYFGVSVSQGSRSDTYVGEVKLLKSLEGKGGEKLHLTAWARLDGQSLSAPVLIEILKAREENKPPLAKINQDKNEKSITINRGETYTLSSEFSSDSDDGIAYCKWSDENGVILDQKRFNPPLKRLTSSNICKVELGELSSGSYDYTLTVKDKTGASDTNIAHITVIEEVNHAPTVSLEGGDQNIEVNSTIKFTAIADDEDGDRLTYEWIVRKGIRVVSTKSGAESSFSYKFSAIGKYTLKVTAKDPHNAFSSDTINITVRALDNIPPVAVIGMDYAQDTQEDQAEQTIDTFVGAILSLDGSYSFDRDGEVVHCSWSSDTGETLVEADSSMCNLANLKFESIGVYDYTLTVIDNDGASNSNIAHIKVKANTPPTANIDGGDRSVEVGSDTSFRATALDGDGDSMEYWWSFGKEGSNSSTSTSIKNYTNEATFAYTFNSVGRYFVKFIIKDQKGAISSSQIVVTVTPVQVADTVVRGSLMWEDTKHTREARDLNQTQALKYCKDLRLGDFDNWRLPTLDELISIVSGERGNDSKSAIADGFVAIYPHNELLYWTGDLKGLKHGVVFFGGGEIWDTTSDSDKISARCVRDTP